MDVLHEIDQAVFLAINSLVGRVAALDSFAFLIVDMSVVKLTVLVALAWAVWFSTPRDAASDRGVMVKAAIGVAASMIAARLLQVLLPRRLRPMNADLPGARQVAGLAPEHVTAWADWSSMPSDHAVVAFALAAAIYARNKPLGWFAFTWAAVVVCLPRLYLGRHYLGDLVVGAAVGTAMVALAVRSRRLDSAGRGALRLEGRVPAMFYFGAFVASQQLATMFDDMRRIGSALGRAIRVAGLG